jgi:hypothetical protein
MTEIKNEFRAFETFILKIVSNFACLPRPRSGPGPVGRDFVLRV